MRFMDYIFKVYSDMAPRSAGRTNDPNKPGYFNTAFEQTIDHHQ